MLGLLGVLASSFRNLQGFKTRVRLLLVGF